MEVNKKKSPLGIIAAIPFLIIAVRQIWTIFQMCVSPDLGRPTVWSLLYLLVELVAAVCLLIQKKTVVLPVAAIIWGLLEVRAFFSNLVLLFDGSFNFRMLLYTVTDLLGALTMILFGVILLANLKEGARKVWFLPGIAALLAFAVSALSGLGNIFSMLQYGAFQYLLNMLWGYILYPLLLAVGVWLASAWFAYPYGMSQKTSYPHM